MKTKSTLPDLDLTLLNVKNSDAVTIKILMLIEGIYGKGVKYSINKYGYTEQRYYQLLNDFKVRGSDSLVDQKRGPKHKSLRTEQVIQQIIRHRF